MVYREVLYKETKREAQDGTKIRQSVPPCQKDSSHQGLVWALASNQACRICRVSDTYYSCKSNLSPLHLQIRAFTINK